MPLSRQAATRCLHLGEFLYLFLIALAFYLLLLSRTGEAHTVWEALHPAFVPMLFVATILLTSIQLTSEKVAYKLLFVIVHSVLLHSFFSIVFPVGDLSGQQMALGRIRLVYDNAVLHGWPPWPAETIPVQVYEWFIGMNFQAGLSVVLARMFSIDLLWVHLFLVPVLWGVFVPVAAYLATYTFTQSERAAVLSSLLISAFPYATYFGAISSPNSLGFILFFFSIYYMLKHLTSNDRKNTALMLVFSFLSFISHYLAGMMSLSLLFLVIAFKAYASEKKPSSATAKFSLAAAFIVSCSILPLSLRYLKLFRPETQTSFTFDKFVELPLEKIIGLSVIGELTYSFDLKTIFLVAIGPVFALSCMIYSICNLRRDPTSKFRIHILFLFGSFLLMLIDYRILKLFMDGLPFNEERLWVFRDFLAVPFVALGISRAVSSINGFLKVRSPPTMSFSSLRWLSKGNVIRSLGLLLTLNVIIPVILSGWITSSLSAAYPQVAPLQTTWYELEAVRHIEDATHEKYVVIGDRWTIYAGEVVVGVNNPRAYYFLEFNKTGYDLFANMKQNPSQQWMLLAMNTTGTTVAYFVVTEPRLGTEEFNNVVSRALQNSQLVVVGVFGAGKLYVFSYRKG